MCVTLTEHPDLKIIGLAPMAVAPTHQRTRISSALVCAGLERCKQLCFGAVVVLGHARYSPRFGFAPTAHFGIRCEYDVPEEVFMAIELLSGYLKNASGTAHYHPALPTYNRSVNRPCHIDALGDEMPKGYWIARVDVADVEKYQAYIAANAAPLGRFGAKFLVRAGRFENPEGACRSRNVVIEFPSYEAAVDCWKSPQYQEAVKLRLPVSTVDLVIIEG